MVTEDKDLQLTNSILNFLRAGFYGQIVFHSVMSQLGSELLDESYIQNPTKSLDRIDPWIKEMLEGMPIFSLSWTAPETFEAIRGIAMLNELKTDLQWLVQQSETALSLSDLSSDADASRILVASIARTSNIRAVYMGGLAEFFTRFEMKEEAEIARIQLVDAQEYVRVSHVIFDSFRDIAKVDPPLFEKLRKEAELTTGDFKAHIHDINLLVNTYQKEITFEHVEFSKAEAGPWQDLSFPPRIAGYRRAYNFKPEEALEWIGATVEVAALAANWRRASFGPADAVPWARQGFAPGMARVWSDAGHDPEKALSMIQRGITDPYQAKRLDQRAPSETDGAEAESPVDNERDA